MQQPIEPDFQTTQTVLTLDPNPISLASKLMPAGITLCGLFVIMALWMAFRRRSAAKKSFQESRLSEEAFIAIARAEAKKHAKAHPLPDFEPTQPFQRPD